MARSSLRADCSNCFALCCVGLAFTASADFAFSKDAGTPCRNLQEDFGCSIHKNLRQEGFNGCTVYDCFGAGQKISQETYAGVSWRQAPETASQMFALLPVMRQLHEMLWYLTEALTLDAAAPMYETLQASVEQTERLTQFAAEDLLALDIDAHRGGVNELLLRSSELARSATDYVGKDRRGADLIGAKLKGADLRGSNLRGAYLIGANLKGADLRFADVIGADLRDADVRGADFSESIFLTQTQVNAAKGDAETKLPSVLARPSHWLTA